MKEVSAITDLHKSAVRGCTADNCEFLGHDAVRLYLHSQCHPDNLVCVSYDKIDFLLRIECGFCSAPVVTLFCGVPDL